MEAKEEIKAKLDVAEIVGEYVTLKPAGSGSFKGVCPFHNERTPSFHVSRERQIWKCFGCDKGGDIFAFLMEMDGLTFPEALQQLAKRAGVELPAYAPRKDDDKKSKLIAINDLAAKYYRKALDTAAGGKVKLYVQSRGINDELIDKFVLGAAPDEWDALSQFLTRRGFSEADILDAGLGLKRKSGEGVIDRFRNRLMVPLSDANGNAVGFTGRVMPGSPEDAAKYMNSPETAIYHKGSIIYGLHLAKTAIRKKGEVIIVEGNLDVVASHKAGVENIVGSSGTALTEGQLRLLGRYTKRLIFCLDDDAAGFAAATRAFDLAISLQHATTQEAINFEIRCIVIPAGAGKDPDDVVQKSPATWAELASTSQEVTEYYFQKILRNFEATGKAADMSERKALVDTLLPQVNRLKRSDEQHLYLLRIADATHIDLETLKKQLTVLAQPKIESAKPKAVPPSSTTDNRQPPEKLDQQTKAAAFLLGIMLKVPAYIPAILGRVPGETLVAPWNTLYTALKDVYTPLQDTSLAPPNSNHAFLRLRAYLEERGDGQLLSMLDTLALQTDEILAGLTPTQVRAEVQHHLTLFRSEHRQKRRKELEALIRQAEARGDTQELTKLLAEYSTLLTQP